MASGTARMLATLAVLSTASHMVPIPANAESGKPPVLTGAAAIQDRARMNGRYCFAGHVHYGSSSGAATQASAKAQAIESWFELVDLEYGGQWSSFAISAAKNVKCSQSGTAWGCEVRAIPCSR